MVLETDVVIVGGGLSGLALANHLHKSNIDYILLEARPRLGGRIKVGCYENGCFDLGPAWFWPGQLRMAALVDEYRLPVFEQYASGDIVFENEEGKVQRGKGYASMAGSYRIAGGLIVLMNQLEQSINTNNILCDSTVTTIRHLSSSDEAGVELVLENGDVIKGQRTVLALPPRVAAGIHFEPELSKAERLAMTNVSTWMAGQAKCIAVYDKPFWRDLGLSGDATSRRGPMVEIHDACDPVSGLAALFGFIGIPVNTRVNKADEIQKAAIKQLERLFGGEAIAPKAIFYQDWALESETSTPQDMEPVYEHPQYGTPNVLANIWGQRLYFGSTEMADEFGGYLEGALESAEYLAGVIINASLEN